jgi:hypothetical protein
MLSKSDFFAAKIGLGNISDFVVSLAGSSFREAIS